MSYPVTLEIDYIERRSRLTTFFRVVMVIPLVIVGFFYGIVLMIALVVAWFALLFTARWPASLYEFVSGVLRFSTRLNAYFLLFTDVYPPFGLGPDDAYPVRLHVAPPLPRYSRLKIFFRGLYMIPVLVIAYLIGIAGELLVVVSWLVIVVLGRQPQGLQNAMVFCFSFQVGTNALYFLLTETYPPFAV